MTSSSQRRRPPTERSLAGLSQLLSDYLTNRRAVIVAEYEFYLLAVRRPDLRSVALAWFDVIADDFLPDFAGVQRRAVLAAVEGVLLHGLLGAHAADPAEIEATLRAAARPRT